MNSILYIYREREKEILIFIFKGQKQFLKGLYLTTYKKYKIYGKFILTPLWKKYKKLDN